MSTANFYTLLSPWTVALHHITKEQGRILINRLMQSVITIIHAFYNNFFHLYIITHSYAFHNKYFCHLQLEAFHIQTNILSLSFIYNCIYILQALFNYSHFVFKSLYNSYQMVCLYTIIT